MTDPTMHQSTDQHPDADLLADLAAEVLPADQAHGLGQHVVGCPRCAGLLADAEGVRILLRADPGEQMPPELAVRLDAAVRREIRWGADAATSALGADRATPVTAALPTQSFFNEPFPTAAIPAGSIPVAAPASTSRLRRPSRGPQRTRRQVREEERHDRPVWARPVFAVAAGLLVVAGIGVAVQQSTGSQSQESTAAGGSAASAPASAGGADQLSAAVPVLSTGTAYTADRIKVQAKTLVAAAAKATRTTALQDSAKTEGAAVGGAPAPAAPAPASASLPAGQSLRDPAALQACLVAIDSAGVRPIAVDLARYAGREAAILVLPSRAGGYEVWAVARDCKPGADGTLTFLTVK